MSEKFPSPIKLMINGKDRVYERNFNTTTSLRNFLTKEQQTWEEFKKDIGSSPIPRIFISTVDGIVNRSISAIHRLSQYQQDIKNAPDNATALLETFRNELEQQLNSPGYLFSESALAKCILREKDRRLAFATIWAHLEQKISFRHTEISENAGLAIAGIINTFILSKSIVGNEYEKDELITLHAEYQNLITDASSTNNDITRLFEKSKTTLQTQRDSFAEEFGQSLDCDKEQIDQLIRTYESELGLRAPIKYWIDKKRSHIILALISAIIFIGIGGYITHELFINIGVIKELTVVKDGNIPYGIFIMAVSLSFLAIWVLRIISRLFLLNIQGHTDAKERIAMTKTFLSLMQHHPEKVKEEDRILILQALFRPSSGTTHSDDGAPPHWFDILMKRLDRQQ